MAIFVKKKVGAKIFHEMIFYSSKQNSTHLRSFSRCFVSSFFVQKLSYVTHTHPSTHTPKAWNRFYKYFTRFVIIKQLQASWITMSKMFYLNKVQSVWIE